MIIIARPKDELIECKCDKCGKMLHIHPMVNSNSPWITDCKLHNKSEKQPEDLKVTE